MTDFEKEVLEFIRFRKAQLSRSDAFSIVLAVLVGASIVLAVLDLIGA